MVADDYGQVLFDPNIQIVVADESTSMDGEDVNAYRDYTFENVDAWRRSGRVIKGTELKTFLFDFDNAFDLINPVAVAVACIDALFSHIKFARSIEKFDIPLFPSHGD